MEESNHCAVDKLLKLFLFGALRVTYMIKKTTVDDLWYRRMISFLVKSDTCTVYNLMEQINCQPNAQ